MSRSDMGARHRLVDKIRAFASAERGVAAVEFAMVVPVLLAIYIGCTEAGGLLITDRKVQSVAGSVGDLVSRSNKFLAEDQLEDFFLAATRIMSPYSTTDLSQTVTAISVSEEGEAIVAWSLEYVGETVQISDRYPADSEYLLPAEMIEIARGQTVIAAEANYVYRPLLGLFFDQSIDLHRSNLFLPRFGGSITVN